MKKKHAPEAKENSERWLLSYADFITLLMVFFIIMYSMSVVNKEKYEALAESLNSAMSGSSGIFDGSSNPLPEDPVLPSGDDGIVDTDDGQSELNALEDAMAQIMQILQENGLQDSVKLTLDERGLAITLTDTITFDSGSAVIKDSFVPQFIQIAEILNKIDNYVRIEGHTDDVPTSGDFRSNWELSTARATSLVELFVHNSNISPEKLSAVGFGEYRPIASNDTAEGRAKNRRVEILVLWSKFDQLESGSVSQIAGVEP